MRTLRKNKVRMMYSTQLGSLPKYIRDEDGNIKYESYMDSDGNEIFTLNDEGEKIPLETGETEIIYSTPVEFFGNFSEAGGEAEAQTYGLSVEAYEAVALYAAGEYPITIGCLIWKDSEPKCKYEEEIPFEIEGEDGEKVTVYSNAPLGESADFSVIKTPTSQSFTRIILKGIV